MNKIKKFLKIVQHNFYENQLNRPFNCGDIRLAIWQATDYLKEIGLHKDAMELIVKLAKIICDLDSKRKDNCNCYEGCK